MKTISVLMATYNGEKYLRAQLDSMLPQVRAEDEVIISDDGSKDGTMAILQEYAARYPFIKIVRGPSQTAAANFFSLVPRATKDIICLCDQDDIWLPGKLDAVRAYMEEHPETDVVMHDGEFADGEGNPQGRTIFQVYHAAHGYLRNVAYSTYFGCCMGMDRRFAVSCLPGSAKVLHDQYFSDIAEARHTAAFMDKVYLYRRVHGENFTKTSKSLFRKLQWRWIMLSATLGALIRGKGRR